jgi:hypothetical protein
MIAHKERPERARPRAQQAINWSVAEEHFGVARAGGCCCARGRARSGPLPFAFVAASSWSYDGWNKDPTAAKLAGAFGLNKDLA